MNISRSQQQKNKYLSFRTVLLVFVFCVQDGWNMTTKILIICLFLNQLYSFCNKHSWVIFEISKVDRIKKRVLCVDLGCDQLESILRLHQLTITALVVLMILIMILVLLFCFQWGPSWTWSRPWWSRRPTWSLARRGRQPNAQPSQLSNPWTALPPVRRSNCRHHCQRLGADRLVCPLSCSFTCFLYWFFFSRTFE